MNDYTKTERILLLIQTMIADSKYQISDAKFREILGDPSKANYHKIINELCSNRAELKSMLIRHKDDSGNIYYELHSDWTVMKAAYVQSEFMLECYRRLGKILPDEMQNKLERIISIDTPISKNLDRKFLYLNPLKSKELNPIQKKNLSLVIKSLLNENQLILKYKNNFMNFYPLTLCQYKDDLYVIGYKNTVDINELRNLKIRRIEEVKETVQCFKYPIKTKWNPEDYFANSSGHVNFKPERVRVKIFGLSRVIFKEKEFFHSEIIESNTDFDLYEMIYTGLDEFVGQLFVYAQDVEIIENEKVRNAFIEKADFVFKRHSEPKKAA